MRASATLHREVYRIRRIPPGKIGATYLTTTIRRLNQILSYGIYPKNSSCVIAMCIHDHRNRISSRLHLTIARGLSVLALTKYFVSIRRTGGRPMRLIYSTRVLTKTSPTAIHSTLRGRLGRLYSTQIVNNDLRPSTLTTTLRASNLYNAPRIRTTNRGNNIVPYDANTCLRIATIRIAYCI